MAEIEPLTTGVAFTALYEAQPTQAANGLSERREATGGALDDSVWCFSALTKRRQTSPQAV